jgi:hypothetical protein
MRTIATVFALGLVPIALINAPLAASSHYVRGYTTKNGTYVMPHRQTDPNWTKFDYWSTKGNINPYTGKVGTRSPY